jgi:hypothetical protein
MVKKKVPSRCEEWKRKWVRRVNGCEPQAAEALVQDFQNKVPNSRSDVVGVSNRIDRDATVNDSVPEGRRMLPDLTDSESAWDGNPNLSRG